MLKLFSSARTTSLRMGSTAMPAKALRGSLMTRTGCLLATSALAASLGRGLSGNEPVVAQGACSGHSWLAATGKHQARGPCQQDKNDEQSYLPMEIPGL